MLVFSHEPLAAKATLAVNVSGVASPQAADATGAEQTAARCRRKGTHAPVARISKPFRDALMFLSGPSSSDLLRYLPWALSSFRANKSL